MDCAGLIIIIQFCSFVRSFVRTRSSGMSANYTAMFENAFLLLTRLSYSLLGAIWNGAWQKQNKQPFHSLTLTLILALALILTLTFPPFRILFISFCQLTVWAKRMTTSQNGWLVRQSGDCSWDFHRFTNTKNGILLSVLRLCASYSKGQDRSSSRVYARSFTSACPIHSLFNLSAL